MNMRGEIRFKFESIVLNVIFNVISCNTRRTFGYQSKMREQETYLYHPI